MLGAGVNEGGALSDGARVGVGEGGVEGVDAITIWYDGGGDGEGDSPLVWFKSSFEAITIK
jgi:hypothetical protein